MLRYPRCIVPVLLASFVGLIAASAAARAEPASAASAADAGCLTKPNGSAAPGHHWYYHLDRASGRRCWHQRPVNDAQNGVQDDAAQSRSVPPRAAVPPPADSPVSQDAADNATDARDQGTVEPATAAPTQPYSWSTAAPALVPREQMPSPASDAAAPAPAPATAPQSAAADQPAPPSRAPMRALNVEPPAASVETEESAHMPALLGAALALLIVVLGSIVARLAASFIRSRRRDRTLGRSAAMPPPIYSARDAPDLVPVMPRERDVTGRTRVPRLPTDTPAARQEGARDRGNVSGDAAARIREDTRALEENVRDLLRRMRSDLIDKRPSPAAPAISQPPSAQELDQVPAAWRGRRRRPG